MSGQIDILIEPAGEKPAGEEPLATTASAGRVAFLENPARSGVAIVWSLEGPRVIGSCEAPPGTRQTLAVYDGETLLGRVAITVEDDSPAAWQFWLPMTLIDAKAHAINLRRADGEILPARGGGLHCFFRQSLRSTIDHYADGVITGWAYDVAKLAESLTIALHDGDRPVARTHAAVARPDVNAHFSIAGDHGFVMPVPRRLFDGKEHDLKLVVGGVVLRSAVDAVIPARLSPPMSGTGHGQVRQFAGRVEHIDCMAISGWAASISQPYRPVELGVVVDGIVEQLITADQHQPRLAGVAGCGYHGFSVALPARLMNGTTREFELRILADGTLLPFPDGGLHALVDCPLIDFFGMDAEVDGPLQLPEAVPARPPPTIRPWRRRIRPRVSLIVLNWNGAALLAELLASLIAIGPADGIEVIVVDHGSTDHSRAIAAGFAGALDLTVMAREANYSFAASNNWAARQARGDFLFFVNNDIAFTEPCIQRLAAWLETEVAIGAVGMRLLEPRPAGEGWRPVVHHTGIHMAVHEAEDGALYRPVETADDGWLFQGGRDVPAVTAAAMMVRRSDFVALGGFDEGYFYGQEDVDFCLRLRSTLGKAVIADTGVSALHHRAATRGAQPGGVPDPVSAAPARQDENRRLLASRFGPRLRRTAMQALVEEGTLWRCRPLRVVFAVTEASAETAAGDFFTARELGAALRSSFGWEVLFVRITTSDLPAADVIVAMRHDFDLTALARAHPGVIAVAWVRNRVDQWLAAPGFAGYHVVLASSRLACAAIATQAGREAVLMPIATNPARFHPARQPHAGCFDIVFTGNNWGAPRQALEQIDLARFGGSLAIFGHGWEVHPRWARYWRGALAYDDVARAYAGARIVVDDGHAVTRNWASLNARVFDGLAAGALVITNCVAGAAEMFGDDLPSFTTRDQLNALLAHYLDVEEERQALVERLRSRVLREHGYQHRAPVLRAALASVARTFRVAIKIAVPDPALRERWGDWHFAAGLKRALERCGCLVRIDCLPEWSRGISAGDDVNIVLRGLSRFAPIPGVVNLAWLISHPDAADDGEWEGFDHVFVASLSYADKLRARLGDRVSALLQCTDPAIFHPALAPVADLPDAVFIGNSRGVERPILRDAIDAGIDCAVIGDGWEGRVPSGRVLAPFIPNQDLFRYYGADCVVLADHWPDMVREGFLSNRLFDAGACGAAVISDAVAGIDEVFDGMVRTCRSADDLRTEVDALKRDPAQRRAQGAALRDRVLARHTFDIRAGAIMAVIRARLEPIPWNGPHTAK